MNARIRVDVDRPIGQVHPHIFGHFIEHLNECIYHGMWAELLQNRKFAGHDSVHYGVVHSWIPVGADVLRVYYGAYKGDDAGFHVDDPVRYSHDNTTYFAPGVSGRGQSQRVEIVRADGQSHGVGQEGIGVLDGRSYVGYVFLRAEGPTRVEVSLAGETREITDLDGEWRRFDFSFQPTRSYENALFSVTTREAGRLWVGLASLMPGDNEVGWRRDVNDLIRALTPPIVRYPGGNFASNYHWQDGVGERDRRAVRFNQAWNVFEPNDVGTDEFIDFCSLVHTEPYLCVNTGDGTPEQAAAWVEYCNGPATSRYGALRAANGHPEPFNVIYWGIGNETYGNWQVGHVDAETYARECVAWARAMRAADPDGARLKLLAVGATPDRWPDWNAAVARIAGAEIDYITLHHYARADENTPLADEYRMTVSAPSRIADLIAVARQAIDANAPAGKQIPISFDEWNVAHRRSSAARMSARNPGGAALTYQTTLSRIGGIVGMIGGARQNYALVDGLYVAGFFNVMLRNANHITMANQAQLVNLLGLIETSDTDSYGTAEYLAFKLYVDHSGSIALHTDVESPTFDVQAMANMPARRDEPYLDVAATRDQDGRRLWLHVVNRDPSQAIATRIDLGNASISQVVAHVLTGPEPWARNSFGGKDRITITSSAIEWDGDSAFSFPACSATSLEIELG